MNINGELYSRNHKKQSPLEFQDSQFSSNPDIKHRLQQYYWKCHLNPKYIDALLDFQGKKLPPI